MKLNCKPGDLAVMVSSAAGNEGKIFTCIRLASEQELNDVGFVLDAVWVIDRVLPCSHGSNEALARDCRLRPLRDNPGQDEILRIVACLRKSQHDNN